MTVAVAFLLAIAFWSFVLVFVLVWGNASEPAPTARVNAAPTQDERDLAAWDREVREAEESRSRSFADEVTASVLLTSGNGHQAAADK